MDELTGLLIAARGGNRRAFAAFVRASQQEVWRLCAHLIGTADADDAVQETYIAAWRALPAFRNESTARTWLFAIARRCAERVSRRRRRWTELAGQAPAPAPAPGADAHAVLDDLLEDLLSGLDPERRAALVLTQVLGLSYAEAAEVCDCPIGTIRSRVARARAELVETRRERELGEEEPG